MPPKIKQIHKNKKVYFDYEVLDSWEAGIELKGHEVKSIRIGHVQLKGSYIVIKNGELFIKGMYISPWKALPNRGMIDENRERKIFLKRKTIDYLVGKIKESGMSLLVLELFFSGSLIKARVGLARGKRAYQKKQVLKERDMDKRAKIAMKKYIG